MTDSDFSLRRIAIPAFGPSLLFGIANGAILPVLALSALELGASLAISGLIAALVGIGSLLGNIPATLITARVGERRAMMGAGVVSASALLLCILAPTVWLLAAAVLVVGLASSVFQLARQSYLTEAVPLNMRARALSTLGGTSRIGIFIGPFVGAASIHAFGIFGAFGAAALAMAGAGAVAWLAPELERRSGPAGARAGAAPVGMLDILRSHRKVFATLGIGILLIAVVRSSRHVVLPLWAAHLGMSATTISLVYGLVAAVDMAVFYPSGKIMDKYGRLWIAVPSTLLMGGALIAIPWTQTPLAFVLVSLVLGFGNGISTGIVMTLAADASPPHGRTQFLGIWRLLSNTGASGGPVLLSGMASMVSMSAGITMIGILGLIACAVFYRWVPRKITS